MRTALDLERWKVLLAETSSVQVTIQFLFIYLTCSHTFLIIAYSYHWSLIVASVDYSCVAVLLWNWIEKLSLKYLRGLSSVIYFVLFEFASFP